MKNKQVIIFLSGLLLLAVVTAISLTVSWQQQIEQNVSQIRQHVARQDSTIARQDLLIVDLLEENDTMRRQIRRSDSIRLAQQDTIQRYAKKMDSIRIVMDYLERADLSDRYRTGKRQK